MPDLEQLQRIFSFGVYQWKHLRVVDAFTSSHPLYVTFSKASGRAQGIGMVGKPTLDHRDGFKTPVWMVRKTGNGLAVVHIPAVNTAKVLPNRTPGSTGSRTQLFVTGGVVVQVVNAEQKGVKRLPGLLSEGDDGKDIIGHMRRLLFAKINNRCTYIVLWLFSGKWSRS